MPIKYRAGFSLAAFVLAYAFMAGPLAAGTLIAGTAVTNESPATPAALLPRSGMDSADLAVIVNTRDPLSKKIADYYIERRGIDDENVINIAFTPHRSNLSVAEFQRLKAQVDASTPSHIQGYALTWAAPYRVGCMSITSAFALGFDKAYCAQGCKPTKPSPYYATDSLRPFADFKIRPTMTLAARSFEQAKQLIDRGIASDGSLPQGEAWLLETPDKNRSTRKAFFPAIQQSFKDVLPVHVRKMRAVENQTNVMFYFTGLVRVPAINSNQYLPGAIADHLTSSGGQLTDSKQMSAMRWLEAGITGSYGTVVEPCSFPAKFPNPGIAMANYLSGSTLLEAYWKSVAMPGQGIFIGEPLAKPYAGYRFSEADGERYLYAPVFNSGAFVLFGANSRYEPYRPVTGIPIVHAGRKQLWLMGPRYRYYRAQRKAAIDNKMQ